MKKILLLMLIAGMFTLDAFAHGDESDAHEDYSDAYGDERDEVQQENVLKTNLLVPIGSNTNEGPYTIGANLAYERVLTQGISIKAAVNGFFIGIYGAEVKITPRFYLSRRHRTPTGWWIGVPLMFSYRDSTESRRSTVTFVSGSTTEAVKYTGYKMALGAGFGFGYQWILREGFVIDLGLGAIPEFTISASDSDAPFFDIISEGIVSIGWAF